MVILGNFSVWPFHEQLKTSVSQIKRTTSWNETLAVALSEIPEIKIHFITLFKGDSTRWIRRANLTVTYLSVPKVANALTLYGYSIKQVKKLIRASNPHLVHGIGTEHIWSFIALNTGLPNVITLHGILGEIFKKERPSYFSRQWLFFLLEKYVLKNARHCIAVSPYIEDIILNQNSLVNLYHIENPVRNEFFDIEASPLNSQKIVFVGHTGQGKGLKILVKAFAALKNDGVTSGWKLSVIGPIYQGHYYDEILRIIDIEKLTADISFKGFLLPHEVAQEYRSAAFLVLPSEQETAPMCVAEAMTCGLPILATRVGGIPFLVRENITGSLFDVGETNQLIERMREFINSPSRLASYGKNAKVEAEKRWRSERIAQQTVEVYKKIIDQDMKKKMCIEEE